MPRSLTLGLELTFLPNKRGKRKEFVHHGEAQEANEAFQRELKKSHLSFLFTPKVDPFRLPTSECLSGAWCIEVNSAPRALLAYDVWSPFHGPAPSKYVYYGDALNRLYEIARSLNLHPGFTNHRNGEQIDYPTGGGHIHVGTDFWTGGWDYLIKLSALESSICTDFTNYPFIRWLFAQWFDDHNSALPVTPARIPSIAREINRQKNKALRQQMGQLFAKSYTLTSSSITQRLAYTGKGLYASYEYRFFDMPRNPDELLLQCRFLSRWLGYHMDAIDASGDEVDKQNTKRTKTNSSWLLPKGDYTLTRRYFNRLFKDEAFARSEIYCFFAKIGLDSQPYFDTFFGRNYLTRMRYGKAL